MTKILAPAGGQRVGVVIQGPLMSRGRTGKTASVPFNRVSTEHIQTFDCVDLVAEQFLQFESQLEIVCVTWRSESAELLGELSRRIPGRILAIDDTTTALPAKGTVVPGNNKYRQILSTLRGVQWLRQRDCDLVLKVRTDQSVDLLKLSNLLKADATDPAWSLLVPWFNEARPWELGDFFFGGRVCDLEGLLTSYLQLPELASSIHEDLFLRWGAEIGGGRVPPVHQLVDTRFYSRWVQRVWTKLSVSHRSILESMMWRGEPFDPTETMRFRGELVGFRTPGRHDFDHANLSSMRTASKFLRRIVRSAVVGGRYRK